MRGSNAMALIARLNPIIRGWAAYYRGVVSSKVFSALDNYVWSLTYRWARRTHPNKSKKWIVCRYFGRFHRFRNDRWVFGARDHVLNDRGDIAYLTKFSWTKIVRHPLVAGGASKDDPDLTQYWAARRRKALAPVGQLQPAPARRAGRALPIVRGPPAHPRSAPAIPARVGALVAEHRQTGDRRQLPHPPRARRRAGRKPNPPGTHLMPPGSRWHETATRNAIRACLSRVRGNPLARFWRGPRRRNASGLPDRWSPSCCLRATAWQQIWFGPWWRTGAPADGSRHGLC